jgi:hypothetical protein
LILRIKLVLICDGNKANNTSGNGIYIRKTDFVPSSNFDIVSVLRKLNIYNCAGHGIAILDYTKTDTTWINIRALDMYDVISHDNVGSGIYAYGWTDSKIQNSGGFLNDYGIYMNNCANNHFLNFKTFYSMKNGIHLETCKRITFVQSEAQEENWNGFYLNNCQQIQLNSVIADNNGRENGWTGLYSGYYIKNSMYVELIGLSTSYHANSTEWQNWSLTVDGSSYVDGFLKVNSMKTGTAPQFLNTNTFYNINVNGNHYGNIQTSDGGYQSGHFILGFWRLFLDNYGIPRLKYGSEPTSQNDGTPINLVNSGTTANRPTGAKLYIGFSYYDTTLGKQVWWNGTDWGDNPMSLSFTGDCNTLLTYGEYYVSGSATNKPTGFNSGIC